MRKIFNEGKDHFIWGFNNSIKKECLQKATLHSCEKCGKPATVNSVWLINRNDSEIKKEITQANALKAAYGLLTELSYSGELDENLCEDCYCEMEA